MIDVTKLDDGQLMTLIENHRKHNANDKPLYADAIAEYEKRYAPDLDVDVSIAYLRKAAAKRRFVSYGELAEANGAEWQAVRYPMNAHLWALIDHAHRKGWPVLSALVVNKSHVDTGEMEEPTLKGFITAARALGHEITDERAFLKAQQEACFAWGEAQAGKRRP